jgi:hypothetical protein
MCDDKSPKDGYGAKGYYNSLLQKDLTHEYYQPMFCFVNKNGELLSEPIGYGTVHQIKKIHY